MSGSALGEGAFADRTVISEVFDKEGATLIGKQGSFGRRLIDDFSELGEATSSTGSVVGIEGDAEGFIVLYVDTRRGFYAPDPMLPALASKADANGPDKAAGVVARMRLFGDRPDLRRSQVGDDNEILKGNDVPKVSNRLRTCFKGRTLVKQPMKNGVNGDLSFSQTGED